MLHSFGRMTTSQPKALNKMVGEDADCGTQVRRRITATEIARTRVNNEMFQVDYVAASIWTAVQSLTAHLIRLLTFKALYMRRRCAFSCLCNLCKAFYSKTSLRIPQSCGHS